MGHAGVYVVKRDSRELLFCDDYLRQSAPEVKEWKKKASQDGLMRLLTKNQFEAEAAKRMESDKSGVLFFIDLDGFKLVNDSHGHLMGDKVLRNTAERIRLCFRKDDLIGRYGGDEFVVYASMFTDAEIVERRLITLKNMLGHPHAGV